MLLYDEHSKLQCIYVIHTLNFFGSGGPSNVALDRLDLERVLVPGLDGRHDL